MKQGPKRYRTEAELCEEFMVAMRSRGFIVHPETADFDILLVVPAKLANRGFRIGDQLGVHAKLRANCEVLAQATPSELSDTGPSFHCVLVPSASAAFSRLAYKLGIWLIEAPCFQGAFSHAQSHLRQFYSNPCWCPDFEVIAPAGVPSPRSITRWKVSAVKLCLEAERMSRFTSTLFRQHRISMQRWVEQGWIRETGRTGNRIQYTLGEVAPHKLYPEITEALRGKDSGKTSTPAMDPPKLTPQPNETVKSSE